MYNHLVGGSLTARRQKTPSVREIMVDTSPPSDTSLFQITIAMVGDGNSDDESDNFRVIFSLVPP